MEQASVALVERRYFEAERLALQALRKAHAARDYERMARIVLPLQEARRQKRDLAVAACVPTAGAGSAAASWIAGAKTSGRGGKPARGRGSTATRSGGSSGLRPIGVYVIDGDLPGPKSLRPGCYLVTPPRVGVDGRALRELADKREIPIVVTVREPTTQAGMWPVVSVGPVTLRAKVPPPAARLGRKPASASGRARGTTKPAVGVGAKSAGAGDTLVSEAPPPEWFLAANEALGDAAIEAIPATASVHQRVDALMERLEALPDHEKLHQALADAARDAARGS